MPNERTTEVLTELLREMKEGRDEISQIRSEVETAHNELARIHLALAGDPLEGIDGLMHRVSALEDSHGQLREELKAEREKEIESGRWTFGAVIQIVGALTALAAIVISIVK